jgi:hypothetical protein
MSIRRKEIKKKDKNENKKKKNKNLFNLITPSSVRSVDMISDRKIVN